MFLYGKIYSFKTFLLKFCLVLLIYIPYCRCLIYSVQYSLYIEVKYFLNINYVLHVEHH